MVTYTDPAQVERLLKHAIGYGSTPELSTVQIADMVALALDGTAYTSEGMQRAAATAWAWKAGLTSDRYDLGAAGGAKLTESQWHAQCRAMAIGFLTGAYSVDGTTFGVDLSDGESDVVTITGSFLVPYAGSEVF